MENSPHTTVGKRQQGSSGAHRKSALKLGVSGAARRIIAWEPLYALPAIALLLLHPDISSWVGNYSYERGDFLPWLIGLPLVALPWVLRWVYVGRPTQRTPFDLGMTLFILGAILGLYPSIDWPASAARLSGVLGSLALFYLLVNNMSTRRLPFYVAGTILVATGAMLYVMSLMGFMYPDGPISRGLRPLLFWFDQFPRPRADVFDANQRFFIHPNGLADFAVLLVPLLSGLTLSWGTRLLRLLSAIGALTLILLLLATGSRGGIIGLAAGLLFMAGIAGRRYWPVLGLLAGLVLALLFGGFVGKGTDAGRLLQSQTLESREAVWQDYWPLAEEFPYTGAGLGMKNTALTYALYQSLTNPYEIPHSHNLYLQTYLEQGILGALGLLLISGAAGITFWRLRRVSQRPYRAVALGSLGAFIGLSVHGMFDAVGASNLGTAMLMVPLGLAAAVHSLAGRRKTSP